ncbi:twin-arginine translocation signal domain-containing protein [Ruegeria sp. HKCCD7318]|nr:twin-arginine translocation signal domain-containing protein [Ruegeria sp. HKCCD7318]
MTSKTSALNSDQLSRRGFLKASMSMAASPAMLGAAATTVATKVAAQQVEPGPERTLIGYPSRLSCRAGDRVEFKVSASNNDSFEADLVRIYNADNLSGCRLAALRTTRMPRFSCCECTQRKN